MKADRAANALLAAAFAATVWSYAALAPSRAAAPEFTSDSAVPVLMANETHWDAFRLYYYAQDRFGAWPFWVAHQLGRPIGFAWTPDALYAWQCLWLFSGILAAMLLSRRRPVVGGAAYLLVIGLPWMVRRMLSDLAPPYAWQIPALLWAWWALRVWIERRRSGWAAFAAVATAQFLAIWLSTLSAPMLAALALLELWRARRFAPGEPAPPPAWGAGARALVPVALGTAGELALRTVYHRDALARFGYEFKTHLRLDWGHLADNFGAVSHRLLQGDAWPVLTLAALGALLAAALIRRGEAEARELGALTLGLSLLALLPIPVLVLVSHVRENLFDDRYFTPTLCFGGLAAITALALIATVFVRRAEARALLGASLAAGALACPLAFRPISAPSPLFERRSRIAADLVQRAPGSPLVNGFWGSYVYAGLVPPGALTALPAEGEFGKTPFDLEKLREATTVVVGNAGSLAGLAGAPWLWEYGNPLRLVTPSLAVEGDTSFALYENAGRKGLTFQVSSTDWQLGAGRPDLELRFAEVRALDIFVERKDLESAVPAGLRIAASDVPVRSDPMPSGFVIHLRASSVPFSIVRLGSAESVKLEVLLLWPGPR